MKHNFLRKIVGATFIFVGVIGLAALLFFYSAVLFSDKWPALQPAFDLFRLVFTVTSGIVVMYATFVIIAIPLLLLTFFGAQLFSGKKYLSKMHMIAFFCIWVCALAFGSVTVVQQVQEVISRIKPFSNDPVVFDVGKEIPVSVQYAFKTTLKNEVVRTMGMPIEGYEPFMFLEVFPGLAETDFDGVEASIGNYSVVDGRLVHNTDNSRLIHSAAKAITDRGLDTLLTNVSLRLGIDITNGGTLTEIMEALVANPQVNTTL